MKKIIIISLFFLSVLCSNTFAQDANYNERHGAALNLGLGLGGYSGYYGYIGHILPVFNINYEFGVSNNFTLAPFVTVYTYKETYYRESVIPIGLKGSIYLDQLLRANCNWDFYLAGSLGFAIVRSTWNADYRGDRTYYSSPNPLFFDGHLGLEYHMSNRVGLFLDLSTGVSTIGLAFH
jgi:hypothetical protein